MKMRLAKPKMWAALFAIAVLGLLLWPPIHQVLAVAAVQNSVERGWEINFGSGTLPAGLPVSVDSAVEDLLGRIFASTGGYDGTQPAPTRNRDIIHQERFRAFFRGPIDTIDIYYMVGFRGDLGAALERFPGLRRVTVDDNEQDAPTEAEWKLLCTRLRALPDLEEVELGGGWITDAALAPLSGHPRIKKVTINYSRLSDKSIETFASMPCLSELSTEETIFGAVQWPTPETAKRLKAALPNVKFDLPEESPEAEPATESAPR